MYRPYNKSVKGGFCCLTAADTNSECAAKSFVAAMQVCDKKMDGADAVLECTKVSCFQRRQEISIVAKQMCAHLPL